MSAHHSIRSRFLCIIVNSLQRTEEEEEERVWLGEWHACIYPMKLIRRVVFPAIQPGGSESVSVLHFLIRADDTGAFSVPCVAVQRSYASVFSNRLKQSLWNGS